MNLYSQGALQNDVGLGSFRAKGMAISFGGLWELKFIGTFCTILWKHSYKFLKRNGVKESKTNIYL
jgi:hypothetical protein